MHNLFLTFQLDLQLQSEDGGDTSSFITNGEWQLKGMRMMYFFSLKFILKVLLIRILDTKWLSAYQGN